MNLKTLAEILGGTLSGDGSLEFARPLPPDEATEHDLAVAMQPNLAKQLETTRAKVALLAEGCEPPIDGILGWVSVGRPRYALHRLSEAVSIPPHLKPGVHPSAVIEEGAQIGDGTSIGPFVYIGPGARIGSGVRLMSHVSIGADAEIDDDTLLYAGVRIGERVRIGKRVIIHPNACIGADGFSFVTPEPGSVEHAKATGVGTVTQFNEHIARIHSLGAVVVGDDVEIGANTCIDRGTLSDTRIGDGTKIDDQVMIGHNVQVGALCMLCGQVGIAGSTVVGNGVVLAGGVAIADHANIGDHAVIGARSGVAGTVPAQAVWMGTPAQPKQAFVEQYLHIRKLKNLFKDVSELKTRIGEIERDS